MPSPTRWKPARRKRRNDNVPRIFPSQAWKLLDSSYEICHARSRRFGRIREHKMLLGAPDLAGAAIENSMLRRCIPLANALTAVCGIVHGVAVGLMLPHVVRFNSADGDNPYSDLDTNADSIRRADSMKLLIAGNLPRSG